MRENNNREVTEEREGREGKGREEKRDKQMTLWESPSWSGPRLTERDTAALRWLVEQRAASVTQVCRLLAQIGDTEQVSDRRMRQIIARWDQLGLARRWSVWHGEPAVITPTGQAAAMFGINRWRRPGLAILRHTVAVAEVRLRVAPHGGPRRWISETELRQQIAPGEHLADGGWLDEHGSTAIEVELTPHGRRRVEQTITSLLNAHNGTQRRWNRVLYLCSPATLTQVTAVRESLPPHDRAQVAVRPMP